MPLLTEDWPSEWFAAAMVEMFLFCLLATAILTILLRYRR